MLLRERYQFGVDVGIGSISDLRIFPIRRSEKKECVARGSCSTLNTRKVLDEEKALYMFINRREKGRERDEKNTEWITRSYIFGEGERPTRAAKWKLFNSTELTLRNCSRRHAPACFTERQINSAPSTYIYIYIYGI